MSPYFLLGISLINNLKAINTFAAASELLFKIGVNPNGTN